MDNGERILLVCEIAEYIYGGFSLLQQYSSRSGVVGFIDRILDRIIYVRENDQLVGVAIYFTITDETLDNIISHKIDLTDYEVFKKVEKESGNNIHIIALRAERMSITLKGLKGLFATKNPTSISWIKPNMIDVALIRKVK